MRKSKNRKVCYLYPSLPSRASGLCHHLPGKGIVILTPPLRFSRRAALFPLIGGNEVIMEGGEWAGAGMGSIL